MTEEFHPCADCNDDSLVLCILERGRWLCDEHRAATWLDAKERYETEPGTRRSSMTL